MNDELWKILSEISATGSCHYDLSDKDVAASLSAIHALGYVRVFGDGEAMITEEGRAALNTRKQKLEDKKKQEAADRAAKEEDRAYAAANDRKQRHHDYFVAAFQVVLGWVLGLIAEHHFQIVAFVVGFFEKLVSR